MMSDMPVRYNMPAPPPEADTTRDTIMRRALRRLLPGRPVVHLVGRDARTGVLTIHTLCGAPALEQARPTCRECLALAETA